MKSHEQPISIDNLHESESIILLKEVKRLARELEEAKQSLRDKEIVFDSILESTLAGYWDWFIPENYEYLSPTFKSMFGYNDYELPNKPDTWKKIIHPDDLPIVLNSFDKHVQTKGEYPYDNEVRYYHKDGSIVWVYCRGKVIEWDENGGPIRMVGCHVDITRIKEAEEKGKYAVQLERKNKELEQFTYVASHDLQEPLRTVMSYVELLYKNYKGKLDENADTYLTFILQASDRMRSLIKGLLDYSRIGRKRVKSIIDCNKIVEVIQADLASQILESNTTFEVGALPLVKGYEVELRLLFQNLITNAIKFRKKKVPPCIKISAERVKNYWKFSFEDNGIGIEDLHKEKIFVIFQRLHVSKEYDGTGIGLAHCMKIVDLHHGKIWVDSKINEGSTFYFTIPNL